MGTSGSYAGPGGKNPLIPSWLNDGGGIPPDGQPVGPSEQDPALTASPAADPIAPARFQAPRSNMSRFVSSGGSNKGSLSRAVSGYVKKGSGGSANAAKRMGSSRTAAGGLLSFLRDVQENGLGQALQRINLAAFVDRPVEEALFALGEQLVPANGSVDAGIASDAWTEVVVEVVGAGITSLDSLTQPQMQVLFESFVSNSIFGKLLSDIGKSVIQLPKDVKAVESIQVQIKDFIRGAVKDAVAKVLPNFDQVTTSTAATVTTEVYQQAFSILEAMGESE